MQAHQLATLALAPFALGATLLAQQSVAPSTANLRQAKVSQNGTVITALGTPEHYRLDLDTGTWTTVPPPSQAGGIQAITQLCFDNTVDDGDATGTPVLDALIYPAESELFDWGVKICNGSWYVDQITVGYASLAEVAVGGSMTVRLYSGSLGWGNPGTLMLEIPLNSLPSDPGIFTAIIPRMVTIDLGTQSFYLPEGPIGWSYQNHDGLTAPLLVDATIQNGVQNFFDVYTSGPASAATYDDTYFLQPGPMSNDPLENSFWIQINENTVFPTAVNIQGAGNNTQNFLSTTSPWINWTWTAEIDTTNFFSTTLTAMVISPNRLNGVILPIGGELIADVGLPGATFFIQAPNTEFQVPIPNQPDLLGRVFYAQGWFTSAIFGDNLTNAYELTVGSF